MATWLIFANMPASLRPRAAATLSGHNLPDFSPEGDRNCGRRSLPATLAQSARDRHFDRTRSGASLQMNEVKAKGPRVFLDYDQAELDAAYNQAAYAPNMELVHQRSEANSAAVRERLGAPLRLAYGESEFERLDLYRTKRPQAPIFVFLHGGAWLRGAASRQAAPAEMFVDYGAHYIALDFISVDAAGGNLMMMAKQVRSAVAWVYRNAESFGGDRHKLHVGGHSSGAHLAGCVLTTDWERDFSLPADIIKGGTCSSGMYDLAPVRLSARSSYVKFDDAMVEALSSIRHIDKLNCPVNVSYGTCETPEFQRQNRDFAAAVKAAGKKVTLRIGQGYNHFEIAETLANPYGLLGRAVLEQMELAHPLPLGEGAAAGGG
jgi:arylformamidase